ncbi:hypothetical protein PM082_001067 [Marasmius tenuissimus]|nr:hypothetical protein PM082_001067 [Marasmius tenuissimus]
MVFLQRKLKNSCNFQCAGTEADVDFVKEELPASVKTVLSSELMGKEYLPDPVLKESITQVDENIRFDNSELFSWRGAANRLSPDEPDGSSMKIMRARMGTTASVALINPVKAIHDSRYC